MTRILVLCTGNSCRSQMAEGFLKSFDATLEVHSAGTQPAARVHPRAVEVMKEIGIELTHSFPKNVVQFLDQSFDYVITVCDYAKETCPVFTGRIKHRLHIGFDDPAGATGSESEILRTFRRVRDDMREQFDHFYQRNLRNQQVLEKKEARP